MLFKEMGAYKLDDGQMVDIDNGTKWSIEVIVNNIIVSTVPSEGSHTVQVPTCVWVDLYFNGGIPEPMIMGKSENIRSTQDGFLVEYPMRDSYIRTSAIWGNLAPSFHHASNFQP